MRPIIFILFVIHIFSCELIHGQDYFTNGNAKKIPNTDCYRLTEEKTNQNGSVWYSDKLDLTKDFKLAFHVNLGNKDGDGADGIVFVMQTFGTNALGELGQGIGYKGFSPAFGIEFDTYQNTGEGDPSYDHSAFILNGINNHSTPNNIAGPVQTSASNANIEDGKDHFVIVQWEAGIKKITFYFDCVERLSKQIDLVKTVFKGESAVYWGFTAATGGSVNNQTVCLRKDILVKDSFIICKGESVQIGAGRSVDNKYAWIPNQFIDNASIQKPVVNPTQSGYYIATYRDICNKVMTDSFWITVKPDITFNLGPDTFMCEGTHIILNANTVNAQKYLWDDASTNPIRTITKPGKYWAKSYLDDCVFVDFMDVELIIKPELNLGSDTVLCEGEKLTLTLNTKDKYLWQDNTTSHTMIIDKPGIFWVKAINACGEDMDTIEVNYKPKPLLDLGKDTVLCEGEFLSIVLNLTDVVSYRWQNGSREPFMRIDTTGVYFVEIYATNGCTNSDTLKVNYMAVPSTTLPADTLVCINETITLHVLGVDANVYWNGVLGESTKQFQNDTGLIQIMAINKCGSHTADIWLSLKNCICMVYYPNAITVNADGLNETFIATYDCIWMDYSLMIYNRWGEKVFETNNPDEAWNGTYKGKMVENSYFIWVSTYTASENTMPKRYMQKGIVYVLH